MTLRDLRGALRRYRWVVLAGIVIGALIGWVSAPGDPDEISTFRATHTLIIEPEHRGDFSIIQAPTRALFGPVPDRVATRSGVDRRLLATMLSAEIEQPGVLLITARSTDPAQAEMLADLTAEELNVELGGQESPFRTLEAAVAERVETGDTEGPRSRGNRALLLGVFGLLLGAGAAVVVHRLDKTVGSSRMLEDALGAPVMAEIPPLPSRNRGQALIRAEPAGFIEAYRGLRTAVVRWAAPGDSADRCRVIIVTSASVDEGKTTTVAHLAATLAESGHSVLVVSADLRKPRLHEYFARPRDPGLADLLASPDGAAALPYVELRTDWERVHLLPSGRFADPGLMFLRIGGILEAARARWDFVLVDCPPLLVTSEVADLVRHADGVLVVARAGVSSIDGARRSGELLRRLEAPVIGAVVIG